MATVHVGVRTMDTNNIVPMMSSSSRSSSRSSSNDDGEEADMMKKKKNSEDAAEATTSASDTDSNVESWSVSTPTYGTTMLSDQPNANAGDASMSMPMPTMTTSTVSTMSIPETPGLLRTRSHPLSVLFLSSDTGGGHRASAMSLARQFELLHPGTTYRLLDVVTECMPSTTSLAGGAAGGSGFGSFSSSFSGDDDSGASDGADGDKKEDTAAAKLDDLAAFFEGIGEDMDGNGYAGGSSTSTNTNAGRKEDAAKDDEKLDTDANKEDANEDKVKQDQEQEEEQKKMKGRTLTTAKSTVVEPSSSSSSSSSSSKVLLPPRNPTNPPPRTLHKSASSPPTFGIESFYKHLSAHPQQWRLLYHTTNSPPVRLLTDVGLKLATERTVTAKIREIDPDVVISVHPLMTAIPSLSCAKISAESNKHLPFFTVVTDLGSGHDAWFAGKREVERIFLASDAITELAIRRGRIPKEKIVRSGLPIRHEFAVHARGVGDDRSSDQAKRYRMTIRHDKLELSDDPNHRVVLVMGGGEGCGALSSIVDSLYVELCSRNVDATVVVVCGRNETLKGALETKDWEGLRKRGHKRAERRRKTVVLAQRVRRMLSSISSTGDIRGAAAAAEASAVRFEDKADDDDEEENAANKGNESPSSTVGAVEEKSENVETQNEMTASGSDSNLFADAAAATCGTTFCMESRDENDSGSDNEKFDTTTPASPSADCLSPCSSTESLVAGSASVQVKPLGFVTNMAEYMVGADLLISKAGPGTIAEAAALGLPVLLTSYLPGQEEGNVDFVLKNGFGAYVADSDPDGVARQCSSWFRDEEGLAERSKKAMEAGVPNAAEDIARYIGQSVVRWMHHHEETS